MNDKKLLRLLRQEPEKGMKKLVERYGGLVTAVVRSRLSSNVFCSADIEDCAAETFAEFWLGLEQYESDPCGIRGRLCVIAARNAVDRLRKYYREAGGTPLTETVMDSIPDDENVENVVIEAETNRQLINAIRALGHPDGDIIIRKFYLGQPSKAIAHALGMSVSNVDTRTHRAVKKLQNELGGELK